LFFAPLTRLQAFQPCAADFARAEGEIIAPPAPAAESGLTQTQKDRQVLEQRLKANETARAERRAAELTAARAVRGRLGTARRANRC
jgi:hypothetical protein